MLKHATITLGLACAGVLFSLDASAHGGAPAPANAAESAPGVPSERAIVFPDLPERQTLVLDAHTHSVFSDGHVWPSIRVAEAVRDGLDAIAITEHLEWQPHLRDIPHPDRNIAYQEAVQAAGDRDLMIVAGSEITREYPAGHMNALFISDANQLVQDTAALTEEETTDNPVLNYYLKANKWPAEEALAAAKAQDAFVFWNHPDWTRQRPTGVAVMDKFHARMIKQGLLHGIEIANGHGYSAEAFQLALKHKLTLLGVSDVHDLIDWDHPPSNNEHRPVTLVFAAARTQEALKQALFERRTVVWFKERLFGRKRELNALLAASVQVGEAKYDEEVLELTLTNVSDADLLLRTSKYSLMNNTTLFTLPAHDALTLRLKTGPGLKNLALDFRVLNAMLAPGKSAELSVRTKVVP